MSFFPFADLFDIYNQQGGPFFHPGFHPFASSSAPSWSESDPLPPASAKVLATLPTIAVQKQDLEEDVDANRECVICLTPLTLGVKAMKLPCGHIFCPNCVLPWLKKSCTCPTCRYELETDNPSYEPIRKQKMRHHKLRLRESDLLVMPLSGLKKMCDILGEDCSKCLEKSDLISVLKNSKKCIVIPAGERPIYRINEIKQLTVGQIKNLMSSLGVEAVTDAIEKSDLIKALVSSGRITIDQESPEPVSSAIPIPSVPIPSAPIPIPSVSIPTVSESVPSISYERMRISELKELCRSKNLNTDSCLEKKDLIDLLIRHS
jgi:Ring finger domain